MGRRPNKIKIACVECDARAELGKDEARRAGWELWLGGARCKKCRGDVSPAIIGQPAFVDDVVVACSECGREDLSTLEVVGGWVIGIHWTKDPDMIQKVKLPLCPGWNKPGRVVRVERRVLLPLPPEVQS